MRTILFQLSLLTASLLCLASLVSSCELRPLYVEGETPVEVIVRADWTQLGADPVGASIYFYPENGSSTKSYNFKTNSVAKTIVSVPSGYYTVVVFNRTVNEFGTMWFNAMDRLPSAKAILESKLFSWVGRTDTTGRTTYEPEDIVIGRTDHFKVRSLEEREIYLRGMDVDSCKNIIVDSVMVRPKITRYLGTVSIRIHGVQNISSVRGYLTGMGGSIYMASRSAGDTLATHVIENWKLERDETDYTKGWVRGTFYCFGLPEQYLIHQREMNNKFLIQFRLVDGTTVIQAIRYVGHIIDQNDNERTDNIVIEDAVVLPDVKPQGGSQSGFDVNFNDWDDPIDVPIGI